jgi:hypothetical protein
LSGEFLVLRDTYYVLRFLKKDKTLFAALFFRLRLKTFNEKGKSPASPEAGGM